MIRNGFKQKQWILALIGLGLCAIFWLLTGVGKYPALVLSILSFFIFTWAVPIIRSAIADKEYGLLLGSSMLAMLFQILLPFSAVIKKSRSLAAWFHIASLPWILTLINALKDGYLFIFVSIFVFAIVCSIWYFVRKRKWVESTPHNTFPQAIKAISLYALPCLLAWCLYLYAYWPGILSGDSFDQWFWAHNLQFLSDWHPVGHTLLELVLYKIWNSPAIVAIFQVIAMAWVWALGCYFFERKGVRRKTLLIFACFFALLPFNGILVVTLWKDILYATVVLALTILLGMLWYSNGEWLQRKQNQWILGLMLSAVYLFRHNGLLALICVPAALFVFYRRQWKAISTAVVIALILVIGIRNVIAFGILKARPIPDAVMYSVVVQHIGAVIYYDGDYSTAQKQLFEKIAPISKWKETYQLYNADVLTKPGGLLNDDILNQINANKQALLMAFVDLALKNPRIVLRSEAYLMNTLWEITEPGSDFRQYKFDYLLSTQDIPYRTQNPVPFVQPNENSAVKAWLDGYVSSSWTNDLTQVLFWRGGIYLFITLCLGLIFLHTKGVGSLIMFIPTLANTLSLFLTMTVSNFRYVYPGAVCTCVLLLFCLIHKEPEHLADK